MSEDAIVVSSAVVIPDIHDEVSGSPSNPRKRRVSSASSSSSKRPKAEFQYGSTEIKKSAATRRSIADTDERKRGKRLFGGLLGTLSQSPASSAQIRRFDIDRKQREKLKVQANEDQAVRKQRLEDLTAAGKAEQAVWDRKASITRLENERNLARFLRTSTKPVLYYRPWKLRPEEEELIGKQRIEVEQKSAFDGEYDRPAQNVAATQDVGMEIQTITQNNDPEIVTTAVDDGATVEDFSSSHDRTDRQVEEGENTGNISYPQYETSAEAVKDHMDEAGEDVFQGDEDAVLY